MARHILTVARIQVIAWWWFDGDPLLLRLPSPPPPTPSLSPHDMAVGEQGPDGPGYR